MISLWKLCATALFAAALFAAATHGTPSWCAEYYVITLPAGKWTAMNNHSEMVGEALDPTTNTMQAAILGSDLIPRFPLGILGDGSPVAMDINDSGLVTGVGYPGIYQAHAYIWYPPDAAGSSGQMIDLGAPPGTASHGLRVNDVGQVLVRLYYPQPQLRQAFLWTPDSPGSHTGTFAPILDQPDYYYSFEGLNNSGQVVGFGRVNGLNTPFLWSRHTGMRFLPLLAAGGKAAALDINNHGVVAGHAQNGAGLMRAVVWDQADPPLDITPPWAYTARAVAANDDGLVLGETSLESSEQRVFIWDAEHGMRSMADLIPPYSNAVPVNAIDINNQGAILCTDASPTRNYYLLMPAPPPSTPAVIDAGETQNSRFSLEASWSSEDPHNNIVLYEYAVGVRSSGSDVQYIVPWTRAGTATSARLDNLLLQPGQTCYFYVRATNSIGKTSPVGVSDGILILDDTAVSPGAAKLLEDGASVTLDNVQVTATAAQTGTWYYVEAADRSSGMAVDAIPAALPYTQIRLGGILKTVDGMRVLEVIDSEVLAWTPEPLKPLYVSLKALEDVRVPVPADGQEQGPAVAALYWQPPLDGLLITVSGRYNGSVSGYFLLGSRFNPSSAHLLRVSTKHYATLSFNDFVTVTGICTLARAEGQYGPVLVPVLRPRSSEDIRILNQ